jgi:hypothetical protein
VCRHSVCIPVTRYPSVRCAAHADARVNCSSFSTFAMSPELSTLLVTVEYRASLQWGCEPQCQSAKSLHLNIPYNRIHAAKSNALQVYDLLALPAALSMRVFQPNEMPHPQACQLMHFISPNEPQHHHQRHMVPDAAQCTCRLFLTSVCMPMSTACAAEEPVRLRHTAGVIASNGGGAGMVRAPVRPSTPRTTLPTRL